MTTQQQFLDLLTEIEPSKSTVDRCAAAHSTLRDGLRTDEKFKARHVDTFLSGSYKRDTAIRPQKIDGELQRPDVDIIVVTNHASDDEPQLMLDELHGALSRAGYTNLTVNRRSINVKMATVDMDVVPIIANGEGFLIPDTELVAWLATNPQKHTDWTIERNDASDGRFKPLVKLFKWWRRTHLSSLKRPKGFILECLVAKHMDYSEDNYERLFVTFMEQVADAYRLTATLGGVPHIEDPGVPGNNVFSNVKPDDFRTFYDKVAEHAVKARKALEETDPVKALAAWREVLGPCFPASAATKAGVALSLLRPALAGGLTFPSKPAYPNKPQGFA